MIWESIVLEYLTTTEKLLISPEYDIAWDKAAREGGSYPDFIAIHPERPGRIYVIEVSTASNLKGLAERFQERQERWFRPLDRALSIWGRGGPFDFKAVAFIRKDAEHFTLRADDIEIRYLEDIAFGWDPKRQSPTLP
ncbi:MAG: hypothetical protein WCF16_13565 [Alphaproteobacteria bacterium]